ncbi:peptide deformylase [Clostridium akagii]|uniref:peptide deformylase n=1 Tax=Clostridium akagii TaxID=91623 RepID=UPI00047B56DB|nr:peptide deformylase [Clostridium akagii]
MALREIRTLGDDLLRKKSRKIEVINKRILTLIDDMKETMYNAHGVGLAAPQVGVLKRLVVIDVGEGPIVLINPEILETSGSQIDEEGCLSIPGREEEVERPNYVKAKALNEKGEEIIIEGEELLARAICHEIDHLFGVLFIDKALKGDE